ncbi:MAG: hypothetical protein AB8G22_05545 [Saprospiraceae bacterium]
MANQIANPNQKSNSNQTPKILAGVFGALLLLAVGVAFYLNGQLNDYRSKAANLNTQVTDLNAVQTSLETELGELNTTYEGTLDENATLSMTIEEKVKKINGLKAQIGKVRKQLAASKNENQVVKTELARLEQIKGDLEQSMLALQNTNSQLQNNETQLTGELATMQTMVEDLNSQVAELTAVNQKVENHLFTVAPAGFRADDFRIDIERRNDKVTTKARQAKEINVMFNLDNVPTEKQGEREIYIAVTDIYGKPIAALPSQMVSIPSRNENLKVDVANTKKMTLKGQQSIEMSLVPDNKLTAGDYNLMVYSDAGYLGSTGFRLR